MRILIISTQLPYPLTEGANIRIFNLIKQLSKDHEIHLASFIKSPKELDHAQSLQPYCKKVKLIEMNRSPLKRLWQIGISSIISKPYLVKINELKEMQNAVNELAREVDAVQAEFPYGGQYIENVKCKRVLDEHNVESEILRNQFRYERNICRKASSFLQYLKMLNFEKKLCSKMDIILATSEEDKHILERSNEKVFVVPNGIESTIEQAEDRGNKVVTYTGVMSYRANVDAMLFFCKNMWPLVKREEADAKLVIVGKNPTKEIMGLASDDVMVTGEVRDIREYIRQTSVFVAPLRIGSGTRIKILEAMAHGKPVVSTKLGCMGLDVEQGKNIYIADDPQEFANYVTRLLREKDERIRIAKNSLELVKEKYTWDVISKKLEEVYKSGNQSGNNRKK